jgi:hypothetical protein
MRLSYDCILVVAEVLFASDAYSTARWIVAWDVPLAATPLVGPVARMLHKKLSAGVVEAIPDQALRVLAPGLSCRLEAAMEERHIPVTRTTRSAVIRWCLEDHGYTTLSQRVLTLRARILGRVNMTDSLSLPVNARGKVVQWPRTPGVYIYNFTLRPEGHDQVEYVDDVDTLKYLSALG